MIQHITEILEKANLNNRYFNECEIDIEVIFSVLNGLSNPIKVLKELGPYAIYVNELGRNDVSPLLKNFSEEKMDRIRSTTSVCRNFRKQDAIKYYRDLFLMACSIGLATFIE